MGDGGTPLNADAGVLARNFTLDIDGVSIGFTELSGMTSEVDVAEVKQNRDGKYILEKVAGAPKPPTLTIKRPKDASMALWKWHKAALDGNMKEARKGGSITLSDTDSKKVAMWKFENAWCSKLTTSAVGAGKNEVVTEEATIVMTHFSRES